MEVCFGVAVIRLDKLCRARQFRATTFPEYAGVVNQDAWFLLRVIYSGPFLVFFREEQGPDQGSYLWIAGRDLLEVGVVHRNAARDGPAVVGAHLVDVRVDASVFMAVVEHVRDERTAGFVQVSRLRNQAGKFFRMLLKKCLCERRRTFFSLGVRDADRIKRFCKGLCCPDFNIGSDEFLDFT